MRTDFNFLLRISMAEPPKELESYPSKFKYQLLNFLFLANQKIDFDSNLIGTTCFSLGDEIRGKINFKWDSKKKKLYIEVPEKAVLGMFYSIRKNELLISNAPRILKSVNKDSKISKDNVLLFLGLGFLPDDQFLWEEIFRLKGSCEFNLESLSHPKFNSTWHTEFLQNRKIDPSEIIELVRGVNDKIQKTLTPKKIRLSGGLDTRFVSHLYQDKNILAETIQSPWIEDGRDLDVNIAKAWASQNGINHRILKPTVEKFAFFMESQEEAYLSGLLGGEFLGGQFVDAIPSSPLNWQKRFNIFFSSSELRGMAGYSWIQKCEQNQEYWLQEALKVFLFSSRSSIYGSMRGSWLHPFALPWQTISPFHSIEFLDCFIKIPLERMKSYRLYLELIDLLGENFKSIPLCSQITLFRKDLAPSDVWGIEPKSARAPKAHPVSYEKMAIELEHLMQMILIDLSASKISVFLQNPQLRTSTISIYNFLANELIQR